MLKEKLKSNRYVYNSMFFMCRYLPIQIKFAFGYILRVFKVNNKYKKILEYKDIHKGKRCFIVATGKSLTMEDLQLIKDQYSFSMNSIVLSFKDTDWRPTYYAIQDGRGYKKIKDIILKSDLREIFCGISIKKATPKIDREHVPFPLNLGDHGRQGVEHRTKYSNDCYKVVHDGHSITYSILQLATYMGFKEIYLLGVDCEYSNKGNDHVVEYATQTNINAGILMRDSFKIAREYADKNNIKIYNATRGGKLEVFERVNIDDLDFLKGNIKNENINI